MGADTAANTQPAASPGRYMQAMPSIRNTILVATCLMILFLSGYLVFIRGPKVREKQFNLEQEYARLIIDAKKLPDAIYLKDLVRSVSSYESVECSFIGYGGTRSTQFNPVNAFKRLASVSQLVELINVSTPIVKHYAFIALLEKNPVVCKKIFPDHLKDKQTFGLFCGCTIDPCPINIDFFNTIKSSLTPIEIQSYKTDLLKLYNGTYFQHMIY